MAVEKVQNELSERLATKNQELTESIYSEMGKLKAGLDAGQKARGVSTTTKTSQNFEEKGIRINSQLVLQNKFTDAKKVQQDIVEKTLYGHKTANSQELRMKQMEANEKISKLRMAFMKEAHRQAKIAKEKQLSDGQIQGIFSILGTIAGTIGGAFLGGGFGAVPGAALMGSLMGGSVGGKIGGGMGAGVNKLRS